MKEVFLDGIHGINTKLFGTNEHNTPLELEK